MAKGTATLSIPPDRLELYDRLVATLPAVERKGMTVPYTSVNGHMFSFLTPVGSLALRLAPDERQSFIERHRTGLPEAHGIVMKEYVAVPDDLFADTAAMAPYLAASHAYVSKLKPKPTKR